MQVSWKKTVIGCLLLMCLMGALGITAFAKQNPRINKTKVSVLAGKNIQLKVSGYNGKIQWKSSEKKVAVVTNKGKVKAKNSGTAVITAKAGNTTLKCKVTVKNPVTSVRMKYPNIVISKDKSLALAIAVQPLNASNRSVAWKSSDRSVVSVDQNGIITSHKSGSATILAVAKDGSGCKGSCKVTVKAEGTLILHETALSLAEGESTDLTVETPDGTGVIWGTTNASVAAVSHGKVTAKKKGSAIVAVKRTDGTGTAYCKVTVTKKEDKVPVLRTRFLKLLQTYSDRVQSDRKEGISWRYSNSGAAVTWKQAVEKAEEKGTTYVNCALLPRWALRELGIINSLNFWGGDNGVIVYGSGGKAKAVLEPMLRKHCEILKVYKTPQQLLNEGNLLEGDICTYVNYNHTNVYAGNGLWYDSGRCAAVGSYQNGSFVFHSFGPAATVNMSGTTIGYIIRIVK